MAETTYRIQAPASLPVTTEFSPRALRMFLLLVLAGSAFVVSGLALDSPRIWPNLLLAGFYVVGIGLAAGFLVAVSYISNAGWLTAIRRVPEAMASNVYVGGLWMIMLLAGVHSLYEWSHTETVAADALLQKKEFWLNVPFFSVRTIAYAVLWSLFTYLLVHTSRLQDETGEVTLTLRNRAIAAVFTVVFTLTFWIASMDWIMSLEPHWYSTIFGIYNFSGTFTSGVAAVTVAVIALRRRGYLKEFVRDDHLHDLGKLLFAFSTFWMYIWFSQYLLIWYANIPEETAYFLKRETAGWGTFTILVLLFNWVIPFIALMPRSAKRSEGVLLRVSIVVLVGHWIDLFWMILPTFMPGSPSFSIWELGPIVLAAGLVCLVTVRSLTRARLIPVNDPMLLESLTYHS
ncbi:MAG: membrane protein [Bacteroidia bacterium]|nr:MAG: membrane protein [Bacteroidia bacterium]